MEKSRLMAILALVALALFLVSCSGMCQSPYRAINRKCCLDANEDDACDKINMTRMKSFLAGTEGPKPGTCPDSSSYAKQVDDLNAKLTACENKAAPSTNGTASLAQQNCTAIQLPGASLNPLRDIDFRLRNIRVKNLLYKSKDDTVFFLGVPTFQSLKSATATAKFNCPKAPSKMMVFFMNELLYDRVPGCNEEATFVIPKDGIKAGQNRLQFITADNQTAVTSLEVAIEGAEGRKAQVVPVQFQKDEEGLTNKENLGFTNHDELRFTLKAYQLMSDAYIDFMPLDTAGVMTVTINEKPFQVGNITSASKRILVPKSMLQEGDNIIKTVIS